MVKYAGKAEGKGSLHVSGLDNIGLCLTWEDVIKYLMQLPEMEPGSRTVANTSTIDTTQKACFRILVYQYPRAK